MGESPNQELVNSLTLAAATILASLIRWGRSDRMK